MEKVMNAKDSEDYYVGIDAGSVSLNCIVVNQEREIIYWKISSTILHNGWHPPQKEAPENKQNTPMVHRSDGIRALSGRRGHSCSSG